MQKYRTHNRLLVLALATCAFVFGSKISIAEVWPSDFQNYVIQTMQSDGIPGGALALIEGNDILLAKGFGSRDISANLPVTRETLFHIGSTQKSMTAMMIATLVDKGIIEWDVPIISYVPAFYLSDPKASNAVTIRHLLSMRGGISGDAEGDLPNRASPTDVFSLMGETSLLGMPGETFSYSNLSSSAAGYLGVLASGGNADSLYEGYAELLQETILDPIGMRMATIKRSEALTNSNYAQSYERSILGTQILSPSYDFDGDALSPSGSLKANVYEMALYVATHMNGGVAPNGTRIVSKQQSQEVFLPYLESYGMGWEIVTHNNTKIIMHNGSFDDYASIIGFLPKYDVGFVILVNSESAGENLIEDAPYELAELLSAQF